MKQEFISSYKLAFWILLSCFFIKRAGGLGLYVGRLSVSEFFFFSFAISLTANCRIHFCICRRKTQGYGFCRQLKDKDYERKLLP